MKAITPAQLREWRNQTGITQAELGQKLGLPKIAITKIEVGLRKISDPEQKLLKLLIYGELPFHNELIDEKTTQLDFSPEQWKIIQKAAIKEGYTDAKRWIVDKIKSYLRMNPNTASDQLAAEAAAPYNLKKRS
ncbi:MAG: helix-turn-helix transcriptional regulator [Verrucomicrobiota bacterium]